ncbi:MAG: hypothetical protein ACE5DX_02410 [Candidatus Dojkabacteria bacterium]
MNLCIFNPKSETYKTEDGEVFAEIDDVLKHLKLKKSDVLAVNRIDENGDLKSWKIYTNGSLHDIDPITY